MRKFIIGNWKLNGNKDSFIAFTDSMRDQKSNNKVQIGICPPAPYYDFLVQQLKYSDIVVGGQDCSSALSGARTSEISVAMLEDTGCKLTLVGHSERRQFCNESDQEIAKKVATALHSSQLTVVLCIGETLEQRRDKDYKALLERQITIALTGIDSQLLQRVVIAYEPIWAIGKGEAATIETITDIHQHLKQFIALQWKRDIPLLYGGSVNSENYRHILAIPTVDGALIGNASLDSSQFNTIIQYYS